MNCYKNMNDKLLLSIYTERPRSGALPTVDGFLLVPWDKRDRKDSQNSGRSPTCNLPPPELTSHTLFMEGDVMNILEEFWYGNIEPAEYDTSSGKEYKELLQLISRNEDKLLATMTEEQKELFNKYADCVREYQVMAECLLFQNSFRLGGRMMLEVMRGGIGGE